MRVNVLRSVLIDHIHRLTKESKALSRVGLAYVYLEFKDRAQQTRENIIGTITRQLLNDIPDIPTPVRTMWKKYRPREAPIKDHIEMLCEVCETFTVAYICIDALDECDNLRDLLNTLKKVIEAVPSVRLICTGRPTIETGIANMNVRSTLMRIEACDDDVRAFIERRIEESEDNIGFDEQQEITQTLLKKYDNMFVQLLRLHSRHHGLTIDQIPSPCPSYSSRIGTANEKGAAKNFEYPATKPRGYFRANLETDRGIWTTKL